jgi:neutral ceramidase
VVKPGFTPEFLSCTIMVLRKILKYFLVSLLVLLGLILLFVLTVIAPVNRTPVTEYEAYSEMKTELKALEDSFSIPQPQARFTVGYSKVNLTPNFRTATAGYGNRKGKKITKVLDSIFVRSIVVDNGTEQVAIVSADLLIIPPAVTEILNDKLRAIGFSLNNTFLGATHTHNSIGNWGEGATRFIYGAYNDSIVHFIADQIVLSVRKASANKLPAKISAGKIPIPQAVENRLIKGDVEDDLLRTIEIVRSDSSKLLFMSFTAHATCLFSRDLMLSRDYPGKLVDTMEAQGYDFAMFMAGSVGSHKASPPEFGEVCIDWMANEISTAFLSHKDLLKPITDSTLSMIRIPLPLSDPQVKVLPEWKVRSWLFRSAFGEYQTHLTALRIGEIILLGTPCDFSGEFNPALDSVGATFDKHVIVTSFNGGYIGYVTPENRFDVDHYETQLMNWYAPGTGEYIRDSMAEIIELISR